MSSTTLVPSLGRKASKLVTIVSILILAISSMSWGVVFYAAAIPAVSSPTTLEAGSLVETASYVVFRDGSTYYAKNGSTGEQESSTTNATQLVQNLIGSGGMTIFMSSGTFQFATYVELYNNTKIHGSGIGVTIIQYTGSLYDSSKVFHDVGASGSGKEYGLEITDLSIDCNDLANYGIQFENAVGRIERVEIYGFKNYAPSQSWGVGIIWGWGENAYGTANTVGAHMSGIYIRDNLIRSATANNATGGRGLVGIYITNTWYGEISGNIIKDLIKNDTTANRGIQIDVTIGYFHVTGNRIQNVQGDSGIHFISAGAFMKSIEQNIISENIIIDSLDGINVGVNTGISGARTHRNQIINNIIVDSEASGIIAASSNYSIITGNQIVNPGRTPQSPAYLGSGIILSDSQFNVVSNNLVIDNRTSPLMEYAIVEAGATTDNNTISNNILYGANTASYSQEAGANPSFSVYSDNVGFVTENSGSATGSTDIQVAHGLAGTPTAVIATPLATGAIDWSVNTLNATHFRIAFTGGGSQTFYWYAEYDP